MAILPGLQYTADVDILTGHSIVEVDMASAGLSVIRQDGLLPGALLAKLEAMPKGESAVAIGKLSRTEEHRGLSDRITQGIRLRLEAMLAANGAGPEHILSVKRDAVFLVDLVPRVLALKNGTRFRLKGRYSAFARLGAVEVYAAPRTGVVDLKGIPAEKRELHRPFTTRLVLDFLDMVASGKAVEAADTLRQFREDYLRRRLPLGFYREFNAASGMPVRLGGTLYHFEGGEADVRVEDLDLCHNLRHVVTPLARSIA